METVSSLEKTIAGWYKDLPHLPVEFRKWLGTNVWWIMLIIVILSVLALFPILAGLLLVFGLSGAAIGAAGVYGAVGGGLVGVAIFSALVAVAGLIVTVVVMGLAVTPLKEKKKKGWTLLFIILLVSAAFGVVGNLITYNLFGVIWALLWAGVEGYFLFEIRSEFGHKVVAKPVAKKTVKA